MISLEKGRMLTPLQKLHSNVGDLSKIIVATGFEWLPKVQNIAQSGHTVPYLQIVINSPRPLPRLHNMVSFVYCPIYVLGYLGI